MGLINSKEIDDLTHSVINQLEKTAISFESVMMNDPDRELCAVCMAEPHNTILVPCEHSCVCTGCSEELYECPLCRAVIDSTMKIF